MEPNQKKVPSMEESGNLGPIVSPKLNSLNSVENQLESLGFVINNGEARFKLDEAAINTRGSADFSIIDAEDPVSFVVLSKDSMESIQASCIASYMDIQQKSVSIDYNSMISSLDSNDVHRKLTELLQENGRLKEALKQNNTAMKQQIGTLASWQEEMMKVHQNHKKKFAETTELIKYLKKENCELKMKLIMDQFDNQETGFNIIEVNEYENRQENKGTNVEEDQQKVSSLDECNATSQLMCESLFNEVGKLMTLSDFINSEIKESASIQESSHTTAIDLNTNQPPIQIWSEYIARLRESKEFFEGTKNRCCKITKNMDDAIQILDKKLGKDQTNVDVKNCTPVLSENCELQKQRSTAVGLQNRLQDILSEYESTLSNLTHHLQEQVSGKSGVTETVKTTGNSGTEEKSLLEEEKSKLMKERESVEQEKKIVAEQKKHLEVQQKNLTDARELLQQKMVTLDEEKTSLDQQSQLYENFEKTLQADKKTLETKCEELASEAELMRTIMTQKGAELKELQAKVQQQQEVIYSLEVQMKMYEEDFRQEKKIKDILLLDHNKVVDDLVSQMEFSKHLQSQIADLTSGQPVDTTSQGSAGLELPQILSIACPKCQSVFRDANSLEQHVENCLDLH